MLTDFYSGHDAWEGDVNIDLNEELTHFAQHYFEDAGDKAEARARQNVVEPNGSETATLLSAGESLPTFNADIPIPDRFIPLHVVGVCGEPGKSLVVGAVI